MIIKATYLARFTQKHKNKKYRFSFTHGTIEQKDNLIYIIPNKIGEGIIKIYEVAGKDNVLVKKINIDIYNEPLYYLGDIEFNSLAKNNIINDLVVFNEPLVLKLKNETKELVFPVEEFKISWVCNGTITEHKITGNITGEKKLNTIDKKCNPIKLYLESIIYKDEKDNTKRSAPLILNYVAPTPN